MIGQIQTDLPILVVDDTNATRYATARMLRATGAMVMEATTGEQALGLAPGCGAIVLDVNLPDIDGFEVCRQLRAGTVNARVPVIHLSAQRMRHEDKVRGLESGADAYLTHPAEPGVLVATINALLRARAAEQSELRSRTRFEAVFRTAPVGIAIIGPRDELLDANAEMCRIFGFDPGADCRDSVAPLVSEVLQQCVVREEGERHRPTVVTAGDGPRRVHLDCRVTGFGDDSRLLLVVDVTHKHVLEVERETLLTSEREARQQAEAASRAKDSFLALLSHELRNPLAPIGSAAHLLEMSPGDAGVVRRASAVIARQVGHMKELIDDLMDVSRVTRGLVELDKVVLDLRRVLETAVEQVRPLINARGHRLEVIAPGEPVTVSGDRTRLVQTIANLLHNAAKYTPSGGQLSLELSAGATSATVRVADNGVGISEALLPHVFDLFTQAERTSDRSQGGLGVGLALVKSLVGLHGGTVQAASGGELQGSVFTIELPLSVPQEEQGLQSSGLPRRFTELDVLIVDDNVDAAQTMAEVLRNGGHRVEVSFDPVSALHLAAGEDARFDLFVLDIGLPGMSGYELVARLKADPRWARATFVALTGYGQGSDRELSAAAGFDFHLVKPVTATQLLDSIGARTAAAQAPEHEEQPADRAR